jgi:hypothetical protein
MDAIHCVDRRDQGLLAHFRIVDHRPELGLLRVQLGEFAPMMGLNVLVGVAPEGFKVGLLCRLLGDAHHAADGRERMMAQPERDNLFFAPSDFLASLPARGVAARAFVRIVCQLDLGVFSLIRLSNCP